jgi:hypothetical protein
MTTLSEASLRIMGDLDLGALTRDIGLTPTYSHKKGNTGPIQTVFETDMWRIETPIDRSLPLEKHLIWFVEQFEKRYEILRKLAHRHQVDIFCSVTTGEQSGLSLSPRALSIFHDLQIGMEVSLILL